MAQKSPRPLKRFIRCTNYEECNTSYPLPQRGELHATGEVCEHCGAPIVEVVTARGPWRICVNMNCPGKEQKATTGRGRGGARRGAAKGGKSTSQKTRSRKK